MYLIIGFGKGLFKAIKAKIIPKQEKQLKCIFIQEYIKHRIISHNIDWKIRIPAHTLVHDSIIFLFCIDHDTMKWLNIKIIQKCSISYDEFMLSSFLSLCFIPVSVLNQLSCTAVLSLLEELGFCFLARSSSRPALDLSTFCFVSVLRQFLFGVHLLSQQVMTFSFWSFTTSWLKDLTSLNQEILLWSCRPFWPRSPDQQLQVPLTLQPPASPVYQTPAAASLLTENH